MPPYYDFRCARGHVTEQLVGREVRELRCACGRVAHRHLTAAVGLGGVVPRPTRYAPLPVSRGLEALAEVQEASRRAGVEPPDAFAAARRRVKSGAARAIE